jgi:hypothetical protein
VAGRRVRGDRAFARIVKQLPDSVTQEIRKQLTATGQMLLLRTQARAPVYDGKPRKGIVPGALKAGLSFRVAPVRLQMKVGLVGKAINQRLFYGGLVEYGHRIGYAGHKLPRLEKITAKGIHGRLLRARRRADIRLNGVPPHPFLHTISWQEIDAPFRKMWGLALRDAASGASDD